MGKPRPIYESFTGIVKRADIGTEDDTVMLIATPATDILAYIGRFKELCEEAFPDATFAKCSEASEEGARYFRMNQEGVPLLEDRLRQRHRALPRLACLRR